LLKEKTKNQKFTVVKRCLKIGGSCGAGVPAPRPPHAFVLKHRTQEAGHDAPRKSFCVDCGIAAELFFPKKKFCFLR
jgi:hypothetical protein